MFDFEIILLLFVLCFQFSTIQFTQGLELVLNSTLLYSVIFSKLRKIMRFLLRMGLIK